jgi:hypothetical protein
MFKYICVKELPKEMSDILFVNKDDVYKVGKTWEKETHLMKELKYYQNCSTSFIYNDYILTMAEYREYRINKILND